MGEWGRGLGFNWTPLDPPLCSFISYGPTKLQNIKLYGIVVIPQTALIKNMLFTKLQQFHGFMSNAQFRKNNNMGNLL